MLKTVNFTEYITKPSVVKEVKDGSVAGLKGRMETTNLCFILPPFCLMHLDAIFSCLFVFVWLDSKNPVEATLPPSRSTPSKERRNLGTMIFAKLIWSVISPVKGHGMEGEKDLASKPKEIMRVSADSVNRLKKLSKQIWELLSNMLYVHSYNSFISENEWQPEKIT